MRYNGKGFSFNYDKSIWEEIPVDDDIVLAMLRTRMGTGFRENINVVKTDGLQDLKYHLLYQGTRDISGRAAREIVFRHRHPVMKGVTVKKKQVCIPDNGAWYAITCTATEGTYDEFSGEFESIIDSFSIGE